MMEMKITVEAPDLAASIIKLAEAIASGPDPNLLTPDEPRPVSSYPTTPAPTVAAPVAAPAAPVAAPVAPVSPAPVTPTPAPGPAVAAPAPTAGPASVTPGNTPAPAVPVTTAPAYTLDQISRAGASLVDAGKMQQLLELLGRYGVQAVTQLQPEQYGTFATELRALGAQI